MIAFVLVSRQETHGNKVPLSRQEFAETPTLLYADQIIYNDASRSVEAVGKVEIHKNHLLLTADRMVYNQLTQRIQAFGNVTLTDQEGNVLFVDKANLSDDLKEAFISQVRLLLSDDAKLTAFQCQRQAGTQSVFDKVLYSPCQVCRHSPKDEPLWQLKAERVIWNEEEETIKYADAWMEIKGVPVLYLPYLSHPSPHLKRKSGFLAPSFGGGGDLGVLIGIPYFWAIDESKDLTITLRAVGSRPMLSAAYRQRFAKGKMEIEGSATYDNRAPRSYVKENPLPSKLRGHIKAEALFNLNHHWRTGLQLERASDQTYLRKFNFLGGSTKSLLVSKGFMEGFYDRNYFSLEGYDFQGLRAHDINAATPMILPLFTAEVRTKPGWDNSFFKMDSHFSAIHRRIGADVTKLSTTGGWIWPKVWQGGQKTTTETSLRADVYTFSDVATLTKPSPLQNGTKARVIPKISSVLEWPFIKHDQGMRWVAEPLIGLTASPMLRPEGFFPYEDSLGTELNDLNLFSHSRFAGLDRIDAGSRLNYGMNVGGYTQSYGNGSLFFGQSYGFQRPAPFLEGTGLDKQLSDYVVRLKMGYSDWLNASVRGLLDRNTFNSNRQELSLELGKPIARINLDYMYLPKIPFDEKDRNTEQLGVRFSSQLTERWSFDLHTARELGKQGGALSHGAGATYQDECFTFKMSVEKTYFADRDLSPGVTFMFRLVFKNLGEVQQSKNL